MNNHSGDNGGTVYTFVTLIRCLFGTFIESLHSSANFLPARAELVDFRNHAATADRVDNRFWVVGYVSISQGTAVAVIIAVATANVGGRFRRDLCCNRRRVADVDCVGNILWYGRLGGRKSTGQCHCWRYCRSRCGILFCDCDRFDLVWSYPKLHFGGIRAADQYVVEIRRFW